MPGPEEVETDQPAGPEYKDPSQYATMGEMGGDLPPHNTPGLTGGSPNEGVPNQGVPVDADMLRAQGGNVSLAAEQAGVLPPEQPGGDLAPNTETDSSAGNEGHSVAAGETPGATQTLVTAGEDPREKERVDPEKGWAMAHADTEEGNLRTATGVAEQAGRTEKAAELRQKADEESQKAESQYSEEQSRQAEAHEIELRHQENARRAEEEHRRRFEEEVGVMVDKVFEASGLEPGQREELLDDYDLPPGIGSEPKIAALYERLGLQRPGPEATPAYTWDSSEGGPSHNVGKVLFPF